MLPSCPVKKAVMVMIMIYRLVFYPSYQTLHLAMPLERTKNAKQSSRGIIVFSSIVPNAKSMHIVPLWDSSVLAKDKRRW